MNRFIRFASVLTVLAAALSIFAGCGAESSEYLDTIQLSCGHTFTLQQGELMIYEGIKADTPVGDSICSSTSETYVKFVNGENGLEYDLTQTRHNDVTGETDTFDAHLEKGVLLQTLNDENLPEDAEACDPFADFRADYTMKDVKSIQFVQDEADYRSYSVYMKDSYCKEYAKKLCPEEDGVKITPVSLIFEYYIDISGLSRVIMRELTAEVTANGSTQTVVWFAQNNLN